VTTVINLVDSADEIQEKCSRSGSMPMWTSILVKRVNFRRA
jgi:hypothetical protein